ncbi:growth arrest and DNA damage-inducible proteins-interacting protein 1 [Wyeomyia smithii]|uniref:growth arrest and DNA damage-inducible proteins-interacting protein 1 n=1 Tax=Wyeomyia smithii TaxID=174621 RepID=UPI002467F4D8|nr:growth arrest and DNA damage-inducible proteins-interacting protein 1 [Wyeomyia smithii]
MVKSTMSPLQIFGISRLNQGTIYARLRAVTVRLYSSNAASSKKSSTGDEIAPEDPVEDLPVTFVDDENLQEEREARIEMLRNKSGLKPQHRNMLHEILPYDKSQSWIHETVKYKRMMLGRYGLEASRVDPRITFPTKQEALEKAEYERVAFPHTLQDMMESNRKAKEQRKAVIKAREDEIARKLEKLDQWTADLNARIAKKEADARAAKERKDRLVEEVRRHFGFKIDPRDERFQEMLAQKEKEDRKKVKEAKRKEKEVQMLEKLKKKTAQLEESAPTEEHEDKK